MLGYLRCVFYQGVSGCGKSTTAKALASALNLPFIDGDDLHPHHNIEKMSRGEPLTDADREPWLKLIRKRCKEESDKQWEECCRVHVRKETGTCGKEDYEAEDDGYISKHPEGSLRGVVVTCSSLKQKYRNTLRGSDHLPESSHPDAPIKLSAPPPHMLRTTFVFLNGPREVLEERMSNRQGHFMKRSMLESQLDTLEDPTKTGEADVVEIDIRDETGVQIEEILKRLSHLNN